MLSPRSTHPSPTRRRRPSILVVVLTLALAAPLWWTLPAHALPPGGPSERAIIVVPPTSTPPPPPTTTPPPPPTTVPPVVAPPILEDLPQIEEMAECTSGIDRPIGAIPPGYLYTPTSYGGSVVDPQPDDTFAADAPGHPASTGRLTTRTANGREEFLVCAHVGTNTPDPALTAFPTTGPGAHPATLTARIVVIDATGATTTYPVGDPALGGSAVFAYTGATTPNEGFVGAWVPFTPALHEPGFTVRVEVRGTAAAPGGGTSLAMGADEVFVHLGPAPQPEGVAVDQSVGVAIDDGAVGERPSDPGPDDLSALLAPELRSMLTSRVNSLAPYDIASDWDWDPSLGTLATDAPGTVDQASFISGAATTDLVPLDDDESRLNVHLAGTVNLHMDVSPRSFGTVSYAAGSCGVQASVAVSLDLAVTAGLTQDRTRPTVDLSLVDSAIDTTSIHAQGALLAFFLGIPHPEPCSWLEGRFSDGIEKQIREKFDEINDGATRNQLLATIEKKLAPADLANGPLSTGSITLPGGVGFGLANARWRQTAPSGQGHVGGAEWIHPEGIDLGADLAAVDTGGTRFPYSYRPTATSSVFQQTHARTRTVRVKKPLVLAPTATPSPVARAVPVKRPGDLGGLGAFQWVDEQRDFDLGMVVNGATVNQLLRALTAGGPVGIVVQPGPVVARAVHVPPLPTQQIGLLDSSTSVDVDGDGPGTATLPIQTHPSVAPLYLPTPPSGWPTPGDLALYVPSLRISIPVPQAATMATDIRMGASATIDTATNHLVPQVGAVQVTSRFLRLGAGINAIDDPDRDPILGLVTQKIRDAIPPKLAGALSPIALPDLRSLFSTPGFSPVVLSDLSVRTVGGGHLGIHLDVDPNPAKVAVSGAFTGGSETAAPTGLDLHVSPTAFPGTGGYTVTWVVRDASTYQEVYRSPVGGEGTDLSLPMTGITTRVVDPCFGDRAVSVDVYATVSRNGVTASGLAVVSGGWTGRPTRPAHLCGDPEGPGQ